MKKVIFLLSLSFSTFASEPFNPEQLNPEVDYQDFIEEMNAHMKLVETCHSKIDKEKLDSLMRRSEINDKKVETLCLTDRDKAEELEESFMNEQMKDPEFKAMMECMTAGMEATAPPEDDDEGFSHTCD